MPSADQTAKSTLYFTPYQGSAVALYDGADWVDYALTERSLALSGLTSGKNYDVFLYDNAGTLTLELSAAWTNDATRADALALQDGVYVKSSNHTRRYLGTIRTTGTTTTEDSAAKRFVWNCYNRKRRALRLLDTTASWTYNSATWRQARAAATNQVEVVLGLAGDEIHVELDLQGIQGAGQLAQSGIGFDSTTAPHGDSGRTLTYVAGDINWFHQHPAIHIAPDAGYHRFTWLEKSSSCTWVGTDNTNDVASALKGSVMA